ncbi:methionyl-tRNA formyltransferase [Vibrio maritimus]|uniref:methionyl-tRNA formyltransferase n=1 Tax=Vibrio maritimus TaxID=990268 RepID=UPI003735DB4B
MGKASSASNQAGFYLLGEKGFTALSHFIQQFGATSVAFVVVGRDQNVQDDYSQQVIQLCSEHTIEFFERSDLKEVTADIYFAIGWRWILPTDRLVVFHDSLLPKYRGFAPLVNMLINGESEIGVTALKAVEEYDKGNILNRLTLSVSYPLKISDAISAISRLYCESLCMVFKELVEGSELLGTPQNESDASYSLWRDEEDYRINWHLSAERIVRMVDALGAPYMGAQTKCGDTELIIDEAEVWPDVDVEDREQHVGKIIFKDSNEPIVVCGTGLVKINQIRDKATNTKADVKFRTRFK